MKTYEFQYYLRNANDSIDEGFLLTEVVSGANKIIAEEAFLDILKDKNVNPSNVYIVSVEQIPEMEDELGFVQSARQRIDELKENIVQSEEYKKILNDINDCVENFAFENTEKFGAFYGELKIATKELIYNKKMDEQELSKKLDEYNEEGNYDL